MEPDYHSLFEYTANALAHATHLSSQILAITRSEANGTSRELAAAITVLETEFAKSRSGVSRYDRLQQIATCLCQSSGLVEYAGQALFRQLDSWPLNQRRVAV